MTTLLNAGSLTAGSAILIIFLVVTVFGALKGLMRGIGRQAVRTLTIAISIIIAVSVTTSFAAALNETLDGVTIGELTTEAQAQIPAEMQAFINGLDAELARVILVVPFAVLLLPLVFVFTFIAISAIGELVHAIVCLILGLKMSKNNSATRVLGMVLGALQGAVVAGILLFPLGCVANLSDGMLTAMSEGGLKEGSQIEQTYDALDSFLQETEDNGIIKVVMGAAGDKLQDKLATVTINGEQTDARESFYSIAGIVGDFSYLDGCDFKAPQDAEKAAITSIKDKFVEDDYTASILSGLLGELAGALDEGTVKINLAEPYGDMLKDAIAIFKTSTTENLGGDVTTFLDVYFQLADSGALTAMTDNPDAVVDHLSTKPDGEKMVITSIIDTLDGYDRTRPLVTMMAKLSVNIMANQLGVDGDAAADIYDNVKDGLNDITSIDKTLSDEEYKSAVSGSITTTLTESGITLEAEVIDGMADYVTENLKDAESLDESDINSIILSYYEAYINSSTQE